MRLDISRPTAFGIDAIKWEVASAAFEIESGMIRLYVKGYASAEAGVQPIETVQVDVPLSDLLAETHGQQTMQFMMEKITAALLPQESRQ